jgi:hypothetical protein
MTAARRGTKNAGKEDMERPAPSPNRPPRARRPPEVARHVKDSIDAYRRVVKTRKPAAPPPPPPARDDSDES